MKQYLPDSWISAPLGGLIDLALGGDWGKTPDHRESGYSDARCIRASEFRNWHVDKGSTAALRRLRQSSLEARQLREGDIVIEISGGGPEQPVGRTLLIDKAALAIDPQTPKVCSNFCRLLRPARQMSPSYLNTYLQHFYNTGGIAEYQGGSNNLRNLRFNEFLTVDVPLPPTAEQLRIVRKIEELFSELDKGIESLQTARQQLQLFREVVLDSALGGVNPSNFESRPLGDLIGPIQQGWSPKCELNRRPESGEWAIIKTTAVQPMRHLPIECKPFPKTLEPDARIEIHDEDILMTRKGPRPRTGVVCLARNVRPRSMLCDTVYRFRANEDLVLPEYLELALNAPRVIADVDRRKSGISDSGISLNHQKVKSIPIPVPRDIAEQWAIVQRVEAVLSRVDNLEADVDVQTGRVATLRQSILTKAFSGQLVAQDAKDEPASILIERISADRDASNRAPGRTAVKKNGKKRKTAA